MNYAIGLIAMPVVGTGCKPEPSGILVSGIEPATSGQIHRLGGILEHGLTLRNVYRIRSNERRNAWYVAAQVYGTGAIDGDVAVWLLKGAYRRRAVEFLAS